MATILLVDDEPVQRELLESTLTHKLHHSCIGCANGNEAVEYLLSQQKPAPELVLSDLFFPEMDGIRVVQTIKKLRPQLPVIVMTLYGDHRRALEAIHAGASDFLNKPLTPERLHVSIQNILDLEGLRRQSQLWN